MATPAADAKPRKKERRVALIAPALFLHGTQTDHGFASLFQMPGAGLSPGTEVVLNNSRATATATATEIAVGVRAAVDGVENNRGIVEAKKVKLTR